MEGGAGGVEEGEGGAGEGEGEGEGGVAGVGGEEGEEGIILEYLLLSEKKFITCILPCFAHQPEAT